MREPIGRGSKRKVMQRDPSARPRLKNYAPLCTAVKYLSKFSPLIEDWSGLKPKNGVAE
jgi:hypothetical protein